MPAGRSGLAPDRAHVDVHARRAGRTCSATCSSSGSSATTSRTRSGSVRYLLFYLAGGFAATAIQTFVTLAFASEAEATIPNIGASGAVSAVLGAYLLLLPRAKVLTIIFFVLREVPAVLLPRHLVPLPAARRQRGDRPPAGRRRRRLLRAHRRASSSASSPSSSSQTRRPLPPDSLTMATFEEHVRHALDSLPPHLARALDNVAIVIEERERRGARPLRALRPARVHAGEDLDLPQAARGGLPRPGRARGARSGSPSCTSSRTTSAWTRIRSPGSATTEARRSGRPRLLLRPGRRDEAGNEPERRRERRRSRLHAGRDPRCRGRRSRSGAAAR